MTSRTKIWLIATASILVLAACGPKSTPTEKATDHSNHGAMSEAEMQGMGGAASLTVASTSKVVAGQPTNLTLTLIGADGKPLGPDQIATSHENKVHVMVIDEGLDDYTHTHAQPGATPGQWTIAVTPKLNRSYKVWADFKLVGAATQTATDGHNHTDSKPHGHGEGHDMGAGVSLVAALPVGMEQPAAIPPTSVLSATSQGLRATMSLGGAVKVGEAVPVSVVIADDQGQPVKDLEPIMGAYAHLVGFPVGATTMSHAHPSGSEPKMASERGGPALSFELNPQSAGVNRLFLQVKRGGQVITLPLTLVVN